MALRRLLHGDRHQIWYLEDGTGSGISLAEFLLKENSRGTLASLVLGDDKRADEYPPEVKKLYGILQSVADYGYDLAIRRGNFKMIGARLGEFRAGQIRAYCFLDRERIVITECCRKKKWKADKNTVERLEQLRDTLTRQR